MTVDVDSLTLAGTPAIIEAEPLPAPAPVAVPAPVQVPPPNAPVTPAPVAPSDPEDTRQVWVCVTPEGPRRVRDGAPCPVFRSDSHLHEVMVACPNCGSTSVRKANPLEMLQAS